MANGSSKPTTGQGKRTTDRQRNPISISGLPVTEDPVGRGWTLLAKEAKGSESPAAAPLLPPPGAAVTKNRQPERPPTPGSERTNRSRPRGKRPGISTRPTSVAPGCRFNLRDPEQELSDEVVEMMARLILDRRARARPSDGTAPAESS
jgi:hypothetical protein